MATSEQFSFLLVENAELARGELEYFMSDRTDKGDAKDLKRTEKLQLMLDEAELEAIDDWRFSHRMPTRAAAIRELLRRGLLAKGFDQPETGAPSTEFRVIEE